MKIGLMQPYAFPYLGYFQLINHVDKWVVFDDIQYITKGWVNRNRILHPDVKKEWQYFTVPIKKCSRETRIRNIEICDTIEWRRTFHGKLTSYKKNAPFYAETVEFIDDCISYRSSSLTEWLVHTLESICNYLDIPFDYSIISQKEFNSDKVCHPGQWALEIAESMNAAEYVNPAGGYRIYNESEFKERNIDLNFLQSNLPIYVQRRGYFVPGLSIIDIMMWNDKKSITKMLADYKIMNKKHLTSQDEG